MLLERSGFGQLLKTDRGLSFSGPAGVLAACPEVVEQCAQAMYRPAIIGFLRAFFLAGTLGCLGLGDGVALPSCRVEFVVLEQHRRQGLPHVPLDVVGEHAQKDVGAHVGFAAVADGAHAQINAFEAAEGLLDLPETLVGAHSVRCPKRTGRTELQEPIRHP